MKAVLMAAGVGSRISRHIDCPKCTLAVDGVPLIRRTVDMLISNGVEVAVVVGYMADSVRKALDGCDVTFYENPFYKVTNSIASLWFARDFIEGDILFANADVFWQEDILEVVASDDSPFVMLSDESRAESGDYFFNVCDGFIRKYGKELTRDERNTEYVGIAKISASRSEVFRTRLDEMIHAGKYDLWWENVLYEYLDEDPVRVSDMSDYFWAEIDYIEDYSRIKRFIETGDVSSKFD